MPSLVLVTARIAAMASPWDSIRWWATCRLSARLVWPGANWGSVMRVGYGIFYDTGTQTASLLGTPFNARFNNAGAGATASFVQFPISTANSAYVTPPAARLTLPVSNGVTDLARALRYAADHGFADLELEPGTEPFTPNPAALLPSGLPRL